MKKSLRQEEVEDDEVHRRLRKKTTNGDSSDLGSRVDAPQKPNCRSPVQGLERQGLRRHLPSRFSVRAELRDGEGLHCYGIEFLEYVFSLGLY